VEEIMRILKVILSLLTVSALSACAGIMNPYKSESQCPATENGKCVPISTAYEESIEAERHTNKGVKSLQDELKDSRSKPETITPESSEYQSALYSRLKGLLKEPVTPMVALPEVRRILILTYPGDGDELYMPRYVYYFADKPRWILDNYLNSQPEGKE
jgi:conjugal transfer pilus assembly protein TraV